MKYGDGKNDGGNGPDGIFGQDPGPVESLLLNDDPCRKIFKPDEAHWGELILPSSHEQSHRNDRGARILIFAGYLYGYLLMEALKDCEIRFPGRINIVGLVTDDPANPNAKISRKKRLWSLVDRPETILLETEMIETALTFGIPCYTGEVKSACFRRLLAEFRPDAIISCVFGQVIYKAIIDCPRLGIYNFPAADRASGHGAGPRFWEDAIARGLTTTKVTVHWVAAEIDTGHIVGVSPPIYVRMADGNFPEDPAVMLRKTVDPVDQMGATLVAEIVRRYEAGKPGFIEALDFEADFSPARKQQLLEPIRDRVLDGRLPRSPEPVRFL